MKYDEEKIKKLYGKNLRDACNSLASLCVAEGRTPTLTGLNGWVFEQTIRYCLSRELKILKLSPAINEQVNLIGRKKIDLLISDRVAIEAKAAGSFGRKKDEKYIGQTYELNKGYVEKRGWKYFYLTLHENNRSYRDAYESAFGKDNSFFLDTPGDWGKFVNAVAKCISPLKKP